MARIFCPKNIYRVNNSSHPRTGNFNQIYWKKCLQFWRWWYMSNLPCRKEAIHHIISGCDGLSPTKYLERHEKVFKYIHVLLLLKPGFIEKYTQWYQYQPTQVAENNSTNILWNFQIQTDHEVIKSKPDIIVGDKINKTANLIEVAVLNDCNVCNKRLQKIRAYTNL